MTNSYDKQSRIRLMNHLCLVLALITFSPGILQSVNASGITDSRSGYGLFTLTLIGPTQQEISADYIPSFIGHTIASSVGLSTDWIRIQSIIRDDTSVNRLLLHDSAKEMNTRQLAFQTSWTVSFVCIASAYGVYTYDGVSQVNTYQKSVSTIKELADILITHQTSVYSLLDVPLGSVNINASIDAGGIQLQSMHPILASSAPSEKLEQPSEIAQILAAALAISVFCATGALAVYIVRESSQAVKHVEPKEKVNEGKGRVTKQPSTSRSNEPDSRSQRGKFSQIASNRRISFSPMAAELAASRHESQHSRVLVPQRNHSKNNNMMAVAIPEYPESTEEGYESNGNDNTRRSPHRASFSVGDNLRALLPHLQNTQTKE